MSLINRQKQTAETPLLLDEIRLLFFNKGPNLEEVQIFMSIRQIVPTHMELRNPPI